MSRYEFSCLVKKSNPKFKAIIYRDKGSKGYDTSMIPSDIQKKIIHKIETDDFNTLRRSIPLVVLSSDNVGVFCLPNSTESEKNFYVIRDQKALESV
jgi:hypothetical protein